MEAESQNPAGLLCARSDSTPSAPMAMPETNAIATFSVVFMQSSGTDWADQSVLAGPQSNTSDREAARDRALSLLAEHEPEPIPAPTLQRLEKILEEADARHAGGAR